MASHLATAAGTPNTSFDYLVTGDRYFAHSIQRLKDATITPMVVACRLGEEVTAPVRHFFLEDVAGFASELERHINNPPPVGANEARNKCNSVLRSVVKTMRVVGRLIEPPQAAKSREVAHRVDGGELRGSGNFSCSLMLDGSTAHVFTKSPPVEGDDTIVAGNLKACSIAQITPIWADQEHRRAFGVNNFKQPVGFKRKMKDHDGTTRDMRAFDLFVGKTLATPTSVVLLMGVSFDAMHAAKVMLDARVVIGDTTSAYERMTAFMHANRITFPVVAGEMHANHFVATDAPKDGFSQCVVLPFITTTASAAKDPAGQFVAVQAYTSASKHTIICGGHGELEFEHGILHKRKFQLLRENLLDTDSHNISAHGGGALDADLFDPVTPNNNVFATIEPILRP